MFKFPLWGIYFYTWQLSGTGQWQRLLPRPGWGQRKKAGESFAGWERGKKKKKDQCVMTTLGPLSYLQSALWPTHLSPSLHLQRHAENPHWPILHHTSSELKLRTPVRKKEKEREGVARGRKGRKERKKMPWVTPTTYRNGFLKSLMQQKLP